MRRLRTALVVVLLLLAVAPSGAQAFTKAIWGQVYRNGVNQFPLYHQLGVGIFEADLYWFEVAPTRPRNPTNPNDPAYQWPVAIAQAIQQAARYHMRVLLQIIGTPGWANGGRAFNWVPTHLGDYANFATAAARHYPTVHLWMIWGEPTRSANFEPLTPAKPGAKLNAAQKVAPHNYAQMLNQAYGALKSVSKSNLVIGGSTYTTGDIDTQQWLRNLRLPDGKPPRMDMWAHNPFSYEAPNFSDPPSKYGEVQFSDLKRLGNWITNNLRRPLPIFLSEWTIPTKVDLEFNFYVKPKVAAKWITDALRLSRQWKRIYALGWINVYDSPPQSYGGLLTVNGTPKPGFYAFEHG